ncbi:MAG: AAA family ATPase [Phormidesmis sp.]
MVEKEVIQRLKTTMRMLPEGAPEADVQALFSPLFLEALGFGISDKVAEFDTGKGCVDHAARHTTEEGTFLNTKTKPYLYVEVKGQHRNLAEGHAHYTQTLTQLKKYLLAPNSQSVQWGIITNSIHAQLFRKHGKAIYPVTPCLECSDIENVTDIFRAKIGQPSRALTIAVYNNKGGVGKTTTTLNLAAALSVIGKRTLVIDFDPNQHDLGESLNMALPEGDAMYKALMDKHADIRAAIKTYQYKHRRMQKVFSFDVILPDKTMTSETDEVDLRHQIKLNALHRALQEVKNKDYDYILIDAPPNWRVFSQQAAYAADVILMPARHDNVRSLKNAAKAITELFPEVQPEKVKRGEAGPTALPLFLNGGPSRISDNQNDTMHKAIEGIIRDASSQKGINLRPFFYPKWSQSRRNNHILRVIHMAHIAQADFHNVPAALVFKVAFEQYRELIKEYFLWA